MVKIMFNIVRQRLFTLEARLESSPEEYFLKKLTGSDRIRIITDASTATDVFVLIRSVSRLFTSPIICEANALASRKAPIPSISVMFRLFSTDPVSRSPIRGSMNPTSVIASVAATIRITSLRLRLFFMYRSRSGIPIGFIGSG